MDPFIIPVLYLRGRFNGFILLEESFFVGR